MEKLKAEKEKAEIGTNVAKLQLDELIANKAEGLAVQKYAEENSKKPIGLTDLPTGNFKTARLKRIQKGYERSIRKRLIEP